MDKLLLIALFISVAGIIVAVNMYIDKRKEKQFNTAYNEFLQSIESAKIICYTNRKKTQQVIEQDIIPHLSDDIKVIFLEGHKFHSTYNRKFLKQLMVSAGMRNGFPLLINTSNGKVFGRSINKELNDLINSRKDLGLLLSDIHAFFNGQIAAIG